MCWRRSAEKTALPNCKSYRVLNAYVPAAGAMPEKRWEDAPKGLIIISMGKNDTKILSLMHQTALIESDRECVGSGWRRGCVCVLLFLGYAWSLQRHSRGM